MRVSVALVRAKGRLPGHLSVIESLWLLLDRKFVLLLDALLSLSQGTREGSPHIRLLNSLLSQNGLQRPSVEL